MIFKLGLKNLKQNLFMNILIILQMTTVFVIVIAMISTIVSRFQLYVPIKDKLNSKGYFYYVENAINPETNNTLRTTDELYQLLDNTKSITAVYKPWIKYEDKNIETVSYDDEFIEMFTPEMVEGSWFNLNKESNDVIQVVVSENLYGLKVGDNISLDCYGSEIQAEIIGIMKDNTKTIGFTISKNGKYDCRNTYLNYCYDIEQKPLFIFSQKELKDKMVTMQLNGPVFVTYDTTVDNSVIESNTNIMKKMTTLSITELNEMKENSLNYIFEQIYALLPILICVLILTLVGAMSISALATKKQLRNYAVYYICGLKWKQCAWINCYSSLVCVISSFFLSLIATVMVKKIRILGETVIEIDFWQIIGCLITVLIYILLSMLLPLKIIGKNTPNQVLKSN